jgi:hypothetical protein
MDREFNRLYLGDSLLQQVVLDIGEAKCQLKFNAGKVLKAEGASIFEPEAKFEPAFLRFRGVRSLCCEGGPYQLNSTVVDFGAAPSEDSDCIEFYFDLTGGTDPEAFMVKVKVLAKYFEFAPVEG